MTKKALLLGGTGAIGVYLAPELVKKGFLVDITSRSRRIDLGKTHFINGDALDDDFLNNLLKKQKYDLIVDFMVYSTDKFKLRHESLLRNCKHYIFLSSYRVFANTRIITEQSPRLLDVSNDKKFLNTNDYSLEKARQEDVLKSSGIKNWTIVRPSITYSKNRFQLGTLEADTVVWRSLNSKSVILPKNMLNKQTTMTWAGDVAKMIASLALNKDAMGDDFNVVTNEHHSWAEIVQLYKDTISLKLVTVNSNKYIKAIGEGHTKYQLYYDRMFDRVLDNKKILKISGIKKSDLMPLKEGLTSELLGFIKDPQLDNIDFRKQERIDMFTKPGAGLRNLRKTVKLRTRLRDLKRKTRVRTRIKSVIYGLRSRGGESDEK